MSPQNGKNCESDVTVHWFRHGLRLHDNPALIEGLKSSSTFYPVFIFDGEVAGTATSGYNRWRFLHECLEDLDKSFQKFGGRLYVLHGKPVEVFDKLFDEWGVTQLTFEQDPEPPYQLRDKEVTDLCKKRGIKWIEKVSHTLWDPLEIIRENGGSPPVTYNQFRLVSSIIGDPPKPVEDPSFKDVLLPVPNNFDEKFALPPLKHFISLPEHEEQMNPKNRWYGGETKGLELLKRRLLVEADAFNLGYVMPNQYKPDLNCPPTSMSPHLRFGCLSIRKFHWGIHDTFEKVTGKNTDYALNLTAQLIWREYFYTMSVGNPNYNRIMDNPICLQIPWYQNNEFLQMWTEGKTGFPWIDACMNQLRYEGWIHHVARHAVACFLTRGDLWISWEEGLKVFDKYLLDADWSVCAGNWMWVSSSAFENCLQCPHCFSPVMYGMRMDPTGEYIRQYVPVLKKMPLRYLFTPWKAPFDVQEKVGCIIGKDYPRPMVDHRSASYECKRRMENFKNRFKNPENLIHCAPSNPEEARKFCWLPDHMSNGATCTADQLCEGIEGL